MEIVGVADWLPLQDTRELAPGLVAVASGETRVRVRVKVRVRVRIGSG